MAEETNQNENAGWKLTAQTIQDLEYVRTMAKNAIVEQKDHILNAIQGPNLPPLTKVTKDVPGLDAISLGIALVLLDKSNEIGAYRTIANRYKKVSEQLDTTNPAVVWSAMTTDPKIFLGELTTAQYTQLMSLRYQRRAALSKVAIPPNDPQGKNNDAIAKAAEESKNITREYDLKMTNICRYGVLPRIDMPLFQAYGSSGGSSSSGGNKQEEDQISLVWEERHSWTWAEFAPRFVRRTQMTGIQLKACTFYPKILYLYKEIESYITDSRYDAQDYWFPFTDDQLRSAKGGIFYSAPYGWNNTTKVDHRGADFNAPKGTLIHAVHDGKVSSADNGWGAGYGTICVVHGDGTFSRYMHCDTINVKPGQDIKKTDVIGTVGGKGPNGPDQFKPHLHLEISQGGAEESTAYEDPMDFFPKFNVKTGDQILPAGEAELYLQMKEAQELLQKAAKSNDGSVDKAMAAIKATN